MRRSLEARLYGPLYNLPGRSELRWRVGTYDSFLRAMRDALMRPDGSASLVASSESISFQASRDVGQSMETARQKASAERGIRLNLSEEDNWLLGLLKAWSMVGDVLTFYQERILNEGYLLTARNELSLHELARMVDHRPRPGVGGRLRAVVTVDDASGQATRVRIPARQTLEGFPPDADPLLFETSTEKVALGRWNRLQGASSGATAPPSLEGRSTHLAISGVGGALTTGVPVLILGRAVEASSEPLRFFRILSDTAALAGDAERGEAAYTEIRWKEPLDVDRPDLLFRDVEAFALRQEVGLFGGIAPRWEDQSLDLRRQYRPISGGVRIFSPSSGWCSENEGLPVLSIRCLSFDASGALFAGTGGEGIYRRSAEGGAWQEARRGLQDYDIRSLAHDPRGALLAGSANGNVYRSTDGGEMWTLLTGRAARAASGWNVPRRRSRRLERLPETDVRSLLAVPRDSVSNLLVGTSTGIYHSPDLGSSWQPRNKGLPGVDPDTGETDVVVDVLAAGGEGIYYAGTSSGVFRTRNAGKRWEPINLGLPDTDPITGISSSPVRSLAAYSDLRRRVDYLFAGTSQGLFRSTDGGKSWEPSRKGLDSSVSLTALAALDDPITVTTQIFAGSAEGLWRSTDHGESWRRVELGESTRVSALAIGPRGQRLALATPFGGFDEEEWPGFYLSGGHLDLDQIVTGVGEESWVVLGSGDEASDLPVRIEQVRSVSTVNRRDFTLDAAVTRLEVEPDPDLRRYDLRSTRVWVQSEPLPLRAVALPPDPGEAVKALGEELAEMEADRLVMVTGRRLNADGALASDGEDPDFAAAILAGELAAELSAPGAAEHLELPVAGQAGRADEAEVLARQRVDPLSLTVYGNLVEASEGTTIHEEILGNGDAAQTLQRFQLARPLAYYRGTPTPQPHLEVRVQGQIWHDVPRLYAAAGDKAVFEVERDHAGFATVIFGDGEHGSRLPSGQDNVVATYRTGTSDVALPPGAVRVRSRPVGLGGAFNLLPGTPGAPPESAREIRREAPQPLRIFERIVSLRDYEDFTLAYPGVVKATASSVRYQGAPAVFITLAVAGGIDHRPAEGSGFLEQLRRDIEAARADREAVILAPFRRTLLEIAAAVRIAPGYSWDSVEPRIRAALADRFGFERSQFRADLSVAESVRVIQGVEGVRAVDVDRFRRSDERASLGWVIQKLRSRDAAVDPGTGTARPAELVLFDPGAVELVERTD